MAAGTTATAAVAATTAPAAAGHHGVRRGRLALGSRGVAGSASVSQRGGRQTGSNVWARQRSR